MLTDQDPRNLPPVYPDPSGSAPPPELPMNRRLVIELTDITREDLSWLRQAQGWNKTTLANRSIQLYRRVVEWQNSGGAVTFESPDGSVEKLIIL